VGGTDQTQIKSLGSVTGRVGYAWDRVLGYVKGGAAWERNNYSTFFTATGVTFSTASDTRSGWTVGVGGEYAFTNWLSAFAEYDYYNFGTRTESFTVVTTGAQQLANIGASTSVFKVGLNARFGMR
jgi:outer membrane immunogenic protein